MTVQTERPKNRTSFSWKIRHPDGRESNSQQPAAAGDEKTRSSPLQHLRALTDILSIPLWILAFGLGMYLLYGYVDGKLFPEYMVTVQPFEISPEIGKSTSLSGKSASDIVVDILNDAASHAEQFHGTDYYNIASTGAQPVSLHQAIKVPIETTYGIEVKGISVDKIVGLYQRARYEQWIIGGDVVSTPEGLVGRIRLNKSNTARSWETLPSADASPSELVRKATYMMLKSVDPQLLGQSYLQQSKYAEAEEVFRQWAIDEPQNWRGSYYLSLVYGYQNKALEASNLASWSQNILLDEANKSSKRGLESPGSDREITYNLAHTTKAALVMSDTSDTGNSVGALNQAIAELDHIFKDKPNVDYWIQRARLLDKEATLESEQNSPKAYERAYDRSKEAIESLDRAIQCVPENGGLHDQRGILLMDLADIMKKQGKGAEEIRATESEEAKDYTRALELRPKEKSALWGAVYAQIHLGNYEDAVDLARTITLLQPDSQPANTALIVALEQVIKTSGKEPNREQEVKDCLNRLLRLNPDESQLLAVWNALAVNNDREGLDLVAAQANRRFPANSTFYDGQTGD